MKNFHTHTYRCKHAKGDVEDYVEAALRKGFTHLGFTDHTPVYDGLWPGIRMEENEMPGYVAAIEESAQRHPEIVLYRGLECDALPRYLEYYQELKEAYRLDYLIGSVHGYEYQGEIRGIPSDGSGMTAGMLRAYADTMVRAMESGMYAFIGHPDLFEQACRAWNEDTAACAREILEAAGELQVALEINTSGIRKSREWGLEKPVHPYREFWEMAGAYGVRAIINTDAHQPSLLDADLAEGERTARENHLELLDLVKLLG